MSENKKKTTDVPQDDTSLETTLAIIDKHKREIAIVRELSLARQHLHTPNLAPIDRIYPRKGQYLPINYVRSFPYCWRKDIQKYTSQQIIDKILRFCNIPTLANHIATAQKKGCAIFH